MSDEDEDETGAKSFSSGARQTHSDGARSDEDRDCRAKWERRAKGEYDRRVKRESNAPQPGTLRLPRTAEKKGGAARWRRWYGRVNASDPNSSYDG